MNKFHLPKFLVTISLMGGIVLAETHNGSHGNSTAENRIHKEHVVSKTSDPREESLIEVIISRKVAGCHTDDIAIASLTLGARAIRSCDTIFCFIAVTPDDKVGVLLKAYKEMKCVTSAKVINK